VAVAASVEQLQTPQQQQQQQLPNGVATSPSPPQPVCCEPPIFTKDLVLSDYSDSLPYPTRGLYREYFDLSKGVSRCDSLDSQGRVLSYRLNVQELGSDQAIAYEVILSSVDDELKEEAGKEPTTKKEEEDTEAMRKKNSINKCCYHRDTDLVTRQCLPSSAVLVGNATQITSCPAGSGGGSGAITYEWEQRVELPNQNDTGRFVTTSNNSSDSCNVISYESYTVQFIGEKPLGWRVVTKTFFNLLLTVSNSSIFDPPSECEECFIGLMC